MSVIKIICDGVVVDFIISKREKFITRQPPIGEKDDDVSHHSARKLLCGHNCRRARPPPPNSIFTQLLFSTDSFESAAECREVHECFRDFLTLTSELCGYLIF